MCATVKYDSPIYSAPKGWKSHQTHHGIMGDYSDDDWKKLSAWTVELKYAREHPVRLLLSLTRGEINPLNYNKMVDKEVYHLTAAPSTGWFDINYNVSPRKGFEVCEREDTVALRQQSSSSSTSIPQIPQDMRVQWLAFEGSLFDGAWSGRQRFPADRESSSYQGTSCTWVKFGVKHRQPPILLYSLEHQTIGHHPYNHTDTVWAQQVRNDKAYICTRDSPVFEDSNGHLPTHVNLLTIPSHSADLPPHIAAGTEIGSVKLQWPRTDRPVLGMCVDVRFSNAKPGSTKKKFSHVPMVFANTNRKDKERGDDEEKVLGASTSWIEFITTEGFRACVSKMVYQQEIDASSAPITLDYIAFTSDIFNTPIYDAMRTSVDANLYITNFDGDLFDTSDPNHEGRVQDFSNAAQKWLAYLAGINRNRVYISQRFINFKQFMSVEFAVLPDISYVVKKFGSRRLGPQDRPASPMAALRKIQDKIEKGDGTVLAPSYLARHLVQEDQNDKSVVRAELRYKVDCIVSAFETVGECSQKTCGGTGGWLYEERRVLVEPTSGGQDCPALSRAVPCNFAPCNEIFPSDRAYYAMVEPNNIQKSSTDSQSIASVLYVVDDRGMLKYENSPGPIEWYTILIIVVASTLALLVLIGLIIYFTPLSKHLFSAPTSRGWFKRRASIALAACPPEPSCNLQIYSHHHPQQPVISTVSALTATPPSTLSYTASTPSSLVKTHAGIDGSFPSQTIGLRYASFEDEEEEGRCDFDREEGMELSRNVGGDERGGAREGGARETVGSYGRNNSQDQQSCPTVEFRQQIV
eukprot:GHVQ01013495.1.p1 GENE.GHVQ01013495.1~~GHVQ01013495.1.p1  ORF type:complete len:806 (+),score=106.26 GHVQ01013495.1:448-2865(+)